MKITILDKFKVLKYEPLENSAIIRFDDAYPMKDLKFPYKEELRCEFSDLNYESEYSMQQEDANDLINFILRNKGRDEIVIHCNYGKGRSPAIGYFISEFLGVHSINKSDYPDMNMYVLEMLQRVAP